MSQCQPPEKQVAAPFGTTRGCHAPPRASAGERRHDLQSNRVAHGTWTRAAKRTYNVAFLASSDSEEPGALRPAADASPSGRSSAFTKVPQRAQRLIIDGQSDGPGPRDRNEGPRVVVVSQPPPLHPILVQGPLLSENRQNSWLALAGMTAHSSPYALPPNLRMGSTPPVAPPLMLPGLGESNGVSAVVALSPGVNTLVSSNICAKCGLPFRMTSDLVFHMRTHHAKNLADTSYEKRRQGDNILTCLVCGENFRERHHLTRHMTAHQERGAAKGPDCHQSRRANSSRSILSQSSSLPPSLYGGAFSIL